MSLIVGNTFREPPFVLRERLRQTAYFATRFPGKIGFKAMAYRLQPDARDLNLASIIRDAAVQYFQEKRISWHTHSNHALSSQVCCLNFLLPLAENPAVLSRIVGAALGIAAPVMLPVEQGPGGQPWFIGFEWNGCRDYLNEGSRTRGANSTSADAVVRFQNAGAIETLLIEWKYTETYGSPIPPAGNPTRTKRYQYIAFSPRGPVRNTLGLNLQDFFYEPFYQLLRQQMLAFQMQQSKEDGAERVRVLHIAPAANRKLKKVTSPALARLGDNAFTVFQSLLRCPEDFVSRSTETLFGPTIMGLKHESEWARYISQRYAFLFDPVVAIAEPTSNTVGE